MTHGGEVSHLQQMLDAKHDAHSARSTSLVLVADGMATVWDVIEEATRPGRQALLKIRLVHLLAAQPDWGRSRAVDTSDLFAQACDLHDLGRRGLLALDIAWLLDSRAAGNRLLTLAGAIQDSTHIPDETNEMWFGYPHVSPPEDLEVLHEKTGGSQV